MKYTIYQYASNDYRVYKETDRFRAAAWHEDETDARWWVLLHGELLAVYTWDENSGWSAK